MPELMLTSLLAMAGFAIAGAITPGPVNVVAMRHGSQSRRSCSVSYVLGASISYAAVVWIMGLSGQWLLRDPALATVASWACAIYLAWLAWRIAQAPVADQRDASSPSDNSSTPTGITKAFMQGAAIQSSNPKAWLVALSGVGLFVLPMAASGTTREGAALAWFCLVSLAACTIGVGTWALMGNLLKRWLNTAARQRWFNRLLAAVLLASIAGILA